MSQTQTEGKDIVTADAPVTQILAISDKAVADGSISMPANNDAFADLQDADFVKVTVDGKSQTFPTKNPRTGADGAAWVKIGTFGMGTGVTKDATIIPITEKRHRTHRLFNTSYGRLTISALVSAITGLAISSSFHIGEKSGVYFHFSEGQITFLLVLSALMQLIGVLVLFARNVWFRDQ